MIENSGLLFEKKLFNTHSSEWLHYVKLSFAEAVIFAKQMQHLNFGWNPRVPSTELASTLFLFVQNLLVSSEDRARLKLFVAIGTSLDRDHKTDAFFQIDGTSRIALLDAKAGRKHFRPERTWFGLKPNIKVYPRGNRIIIRESDFVEPLVLQYKAHKIVGFLSKEDERLNEPVDLHSLQKKLIADWRIAKISQIRKGVRERSNCSTKPVGIKKVTPPNLEKELDPKECIARLKNVLGL